MGAYQGLPQQTCREFIAQNCKASVLRVFPGQLLDVRVNEVWSPGKEDIERLRGQGNCYSIPGFASSEPQRKAGDSRWHPLYSRPFKCLKKLGSTSSLRGHGQIRFA